MLTYAIGFIQNVQLACFAIVLVLMAAMDRSNRSLRWLACGYIAGLTGGIFQFADQLLPGWISVPFYMIAAPVGYACFHASIVAFVRRGERTRWVSVALLGGSLPVYLYLSMPWMNAHFAQMDRISTLSDFTLAVQTMLSAWLLLSTVDAETARPRRVMGAFLGFYSAVEYARVVAYFATGQLPDRAAPWVEVASGMVYVVSCSVLPLAFIWMMNARLHAHMARQMTTDALTGLLNRRGLESAGELEVARYKRSREDFAVVLMDVDHFKRQNDTFGHAGGDLVLCEIAELFRGLVRESDVLGRLGGEEFVLLLANTPAAGAVSLVEGLRKAMEAHRFELDGKRFNVTASFGVTVTGGRREVEWETLLREADQALYAAKDAGRNTCRFHEGAQQSEWKRRMEARAESELETA
jgi:diguanylate cyclase (GGDEF)-like protein